MTAQDTRHAILDAAEAMLAEVGFASMSLRALTGRAGVNLAAVNYHFGSKEELTKAAMARRIDPVNTDRLRQLEALEHRAAGPGDPGAIVRALLAPAVALAHQQEHVHSCAMLGRLLTEQPAFLRDWLVEQFRPVTQRFGAALQRALPELALDEVLWRLHFAIGAMTHTMMHAQLFSGLTEGVCDADDHAALLERLVAFCTAGMTAPSSAQLPGQVSGQGGRP